MVPEDWDAAQMYMCAPKFISDLIGESPIFSAAGSSRLCGFFLSTRDEGVRWRKARVLGICSGAARI